MTKQTIRGTCRLCGKTMSKSGMTRHLDACMAQHEPGGRSGNLFRIRVEDAWSPLFWMDLEMRGSSRFDELDDFLRGIWLECCGHLSAFEKPGKAPARDFDLSFSAPWEVGALGPNDVDMNARLDKELGVDTKLEYTYDFGSSTQLKLRVTGVRKGRIGEDAVRLLSRNEPPVLECITCGVPATQVDVEAWMSGDAEWYCDAHVPEEIDEAFLLPVVNSPRMGVCAYTGPEPGSHYATL